ncbi:MAG TPA: hypothetical protein VMM81_06085 [Acidimicrobiia bacterium]|nr:hypothetical protein [Acidimicrobiia bacterium]
MTRETRRRLLPVALLAAAMAVATFPAPPAVAGGSGGLRVEASTLWLLDADDTAVRVTIDFTLTNLREDVVEGDSVTSFFFETLRVGMPPEAVEISASSGDTNLSVLPVVTEGEEGQSSLSAIVNLPARLEYRETQTLTVAFELPGSPPRSDGRVRVNPAYAAFDARAWGDPGRSSVEVRVADGYEVRTFGAEVTPVSLGGYTVFSAREIEEPASWFVFVSARNDDALDVSVAAVDDLAVRILSWPGDAEWATQVRDLAETGLPFLRDLVGLDYAPVEGVDIYQARDPSLLGFAGWYIADQDRIEMGEVVDAHVILHELTHLWFNQRLFSSRWINEGMAEVFAAHATEALGREVDADHGSPTQPVLGDPSRVALNEWLFPEVAPSEDRSTRNRELFGYNASFWVVAGIAADVGIDGLQRVIRAASEGLAAYRVPDRDPEAADEPRVEWRRFLDLLEEHAGATSIRDLFRDYVVTAEERALLDERDRARAAYEPLRSGHMAPPWAVRRLLDAWDFTEARKAIAAATDILAIADDIVATLSGTGLELPRSLVTTYESATTLADLDAAALIAGRHLEAALVLATAQKAFDTPRDPLVRLGLFGSDAAGRLDSARTAFAAEDPPTTIREAEAVLELFAGARDAGRLRAFWAGGVALFALGIVVTWVVVRWRRRRRARDSG